MQRILVIDDDRMLRREVLHALADEYEILEASDPEIGIQRAIHDQPDLILLDVLMPKMDGISALRILRSDARTAGIPVIIVSSLGAEEQVNACIEEGAVDHVTKPFSHPMLRARISTLFSKRTLNEFAEQLENAAAANAAGRVIGFLGAKGGVGATTVAANVASQAALSGHDAILCEMRRSFGSLSLQFHTKTRKNLGALVTDYCKSTKVDFNDYLAQDTSGLRILFGPRIEDGEIELDGMRVRALVEGLRTSCDFLFVDLATGLSSLNTQILDLCDHVVLVVDCEMTSIVLARRIVEQLQQTLSSDVVKAVVVKRTPLSLPPRADEIRKLLGCDLIGVLPQAADALASAVRTGSTLAMLEPNDLLSTAVRDLTDQHLLADGPLANSVS